MFKISGTKQDAIKPFRLVKYFTFTSLIVMFLGTIILSALNSYWVRSMVLKKSEDYAMLLVENLSHQIFLQFTIPIALKYGKIQLRKKNQFELMDEVIKSTLHSFKVNTVNIYGLDNIISYSFDHDMIGKKGLGGAGFNKAIKGNSNSSLVQKGNFLETLLGLQKKSNTRTFAPLRASFDVQIEKRLIIKGGSILGIIEIIQDLSDEHKTISNFQRRVILTCSIIMACLFLILLYSVKRGEDIIKKRNEEQLKLKEELNRAKHLSLIGGMTATISHEIRNPLGIIQSSAELLKKKIERTDPSNTIPDIIIEESGRLNDITTDFLDFARPKLPLLLPCYIENIIEKNLAFLAPQIKKKGHTINKYYDNAVPQVLADTDMMYQAFLNILINSMHSMPEAGTITVRITHKQNTIIICFEDDGGSIPEDILEKIWEPFFTTKEKGTGLGLGIVKNIIEGHQGNIRIENRSKGGIRVIITLPIRHEK